MKTVIYLKIIIYVKIFLFISFILLKVGTIGRKSSKSKVLRVKFTDVLWLGIIILMIKEMITL